MPGRGGFSTMAIFVTGGTGFLGVNLVRRLVERGHRVRLLARPNASRLGLESDLIEFVTGDVTDNQSVFNAMTGCDQVYHLAAWVQVSSWGMETARSVNVEGTRNVCDAALKHGVQRMVHTSSIATIAAGTLDHPADEQTSWNLQYLKVPYYVTKRESEDVVQDYIKQGLVAVIVNPTYLVGPWDIKPSAGRMLIRMARQRFRLLPSSGGINYVDVRAAADGHLLAMERGKTGERYVLGGENLSFRTFWDRVAGIAGVSVVGLTVPYAIAYPAYACGSLLGYLMPCLLRDANLSVLRCGFLEHYVHSEKARKELGYEPIPVDQAIKDALAWFIENDYMKPPPSMRTP